MVGGAGSAGGTGTMGESSCFLPLLGPAGPALVYFLRERGLSPLGELVFQRVYAEYFGQLFAGGFHIFRIRSAECYLFSA